MADSITAGRDPFTFGLDDKVVTRLDVDGIIVAYAFDNDGPFYLVEQRNGSFWYRARQLRHASKAD